MAQIVAQNGWTLYEFPLPENEGGGIHRAALPIILSGSGQELKDFISGGLASDGNFVSAMAFHYGWKSIGTTEENLEKQIQDAKNFIEWAENELAENKGKKDVTSA